MQSPPQVPTPTPPPAPTALPAPASIVIVGADGKTQTLAIPRTADELRALEARREQISNQLESVTDRRGDLAEELGTTGADAARPGIEARIALLDRRILQLESDLDATGRQIAQASPAVIATASESEPAPADYPDNFEDGLVVGGLSVLFFMSVVLFMTRRRWRRPGSGRFPQLGSDSAQRFERLEQGMDAIAIEIERVSEGQRFVTKLLSEQQQAPPAVTGVSPAARVRRE
jgi:hypothetical protein